MMCWNVFASVALLNFFYAGVFTIILHDHYYRDPQIPIFLWQSISNYFLVFADTEYRYEYLILQLLFKELIWTHCFSGNSYTIEIYKYYRNNMYHSVMFLYAHFHNLFISYIFLAHECLFMCQKYIRYKKMCLRIYLNTQI